MSYFSIYNLFKSFSLTVSYFSIYNLFQSFSLTVSYFSIYNLFKSFSLTVSYFSIYNLFKSFSLTVSYFSIYNLFKSFSLTVFYFSIYNLFEFPLRESCDKFTLSLLPTTRQGNTLYKLSSPLHLDTAHCSSLHVNLAGSGHPPSILLSAH